MKRISRSIVRLIRATIKFFDKWLITPLTKLFVTVSDLFGNKSTKLEKYFINR